MQEDVAKVSILLTIESVGGGPQKNLLDVPSAKSMHVAPSAIWPYDMFGPEQSGRPWKK